MTAHPDALAPDAPEPLWSGRFESAPSEFASEFGASLPVDQRMWESDIAGSKAHAAMLARQGIITPEDAQSITDGLDRIARRIEDGTFDFDIADEDIHMSIERALTDDIGRAGGRLHTARSRNDQVATDTRLHAKKLAEGLAHQVLDLRAVILDVAERNFGAVMPGYTHLQKAQPVLFSHHMLAFYWMLARDFTRLLAARDAADVMPLGSAALAGTTYPLDRGSVAADLGFSSVSPNSMDAVSDRDFLCDLAYAASVCQMHLSRLCEEIVLWSSDEFGFIKLSDAYSTGSSIMPQKKNPDFAELIRGKTGRVYGDLMALLVTMKGLPLAYNKDMQEDKEGVFDAVDTLSASLAVMSGMLDTMTVDSEAMRAGAEGGFMAATDLADWLVGRGVPFREAHAAVGELVLACERDGKTLQELTADELAAYDERFAGGGEPGGEAAGGMSATDSVDIDKVVARRTTEGGTAPESVRAQLEEARAQQATDAQRL